MANTKLIFYGTEQSKTDEHEVVCYLNDKNEIYLELSIPYFEPLKAFICFDKSTAIKFAKTIRTNINLMEDEEVYNG